MPSVATAPTATAAQTSAAGSRMLGFYLGVGGVKVDCLFDTANFMVKDGAGTYRAAPAANKDVRILAAAHDTISAPTGGLTFTRTDGGQLQAIFGAENGGLVMAAREGLIFATGGAGLYSSTVERARIDPAGTLLINRTASSGLGKLNVEGGADFTGGNVYLCRDTGNVAVGGASGAFRLHVQSSGEIARFDTTTPRGSGNGYISIGDPSGRKGYFGFGGAGDDWLMANEMAGLLIFNTAGVNRWAIGSAALLPLVDNVSTLGGPSNRVSVVYAASGTINTSDEREKTWRGTPSGAELSAARRIAAELGFYQWNDAVAEKGEDGARYHFGVRAQAVWAIMADEGLIDPIAEGETPSSRYAFLCYDEWEEETAPVMEWWRPSDILGTDGRPVMVRCAEGEDGTEQRPTGDTYVTRPAGDRFGIRPDQLTLFLIAAQEARIAAIEAHLAAPGQ